MDSMHNTTDRMLPYSWAICYAPLRCAACMHAASSALLVQRTPSYPTSDLIRCISPCDSHSCSSDYAIVSLSGMPSLPCRLPCLQRLSASIPPRRSRVSTPQRPEAGPGAAVSLSPCPPESQPGELRKGRLGSGEFPSCNGLAQRRFTTAGVLMSVS